MDRNIHRCMHAYKQANIHTYIYTYAHAHIRTYKHTYAYTYVHTYIRTYIHTYIHTHIHTYIHSYIHTYIHTYAHTCPLIGKGDNGRILECSIFFFVCFRTLFGNQLQSWTMNRLAGQLPSSLSVFEVRGYRDWTPDDSLLQIKSLQVIRGVFLSNSCASCMLQRNYVYRGFRFEEKRKPSDFTYSPRELSNGEFVYGAPTYCRAHVYKVIGNVTRLISGYGFFPRCITEREECFNSEIVSTPIHRCYKTDNNILNITLVIGPIALILNVLTVVVFLSTKSLRRTTSMLLVSNMAISDILISFYTVSIVIARKASYLYYLTFTETFCKFFGFIWCLGQFVLVTTSLLLTVERYLAIVFVMNPDRKLRSGRALRCIAVSWILAITSSSLPFVGIGTYTQNTYCIPFRTHRDDKYSYELTITMSILGISQYLITIALYTHIYVSVKKAGKVNGNRREHAIAKRIALLVFSNMIFYLMPILIAVIWFFTSITWDMSPSTKGILTSALPLLLFSINSLLNPLLYAFRNDAFTRVLKGRVLRLHPKKCTFKSKSKKEAYV